MTLTGPIAKVYSGRPGCGCGCRGRYFEDARNITRVLNVMRARADEVQIIGGTLVLEGPGRWYWAYPA